MDMISGTGQAVGNIAWSCSYYWILGVALDGSGSHQHRQSYSWMRGEGMSLSGICGACGMMRYKCKVAQTSDHDEAI